METRWLGKIAANLEAEYQFIAQDYPQVARQFIEEAKRVTELLPYQPAMGRPGRVLGTREIGLSLFPYIIPYRVKDNTIQILRLFYTYCRLPSAW